MARKPKPYSKGGFKNFMKKFNFSSIKDKLSRVFKRKKSIEDEFDFEEEYSADEDYYEEEEEFEDDESQFQSQELTVNDIRKKQIENGEAPPELPEDSVDVTDPNYQIPSDEMDVTNPAYNEFKIPSKKQKIKEKLASSKKNISEFFKSKMNSESLKSSGKGLSEYFKNFDFDQVFNQIFSAVNREKIHRGFIILSLVSITYGAGKTVALLLSPSPVAKKPKKISPITTGASGQFRDDIRTIKTADLFGAKGKEEPVIASKPKAFEGTCVKANRSSSLPIKLLSTIVLQDSVKSVASVQLRSKKSLLSIRQGEKLSSMAEVGLIEDEKIVFKNLKTGQCEYVAVKKKRSRRPKAPIRVERDAKKGKKILNNSKNKGISNQGNTFKIKKSVRDEMLSNISEVLTQAKAVQIKNPDGTLSFRMTDIVPGSIYSQLNIQNGDVITGINGKKIKNLNEMMALFGQIKDIDHFELILNRNGMEQNLEYDFE